MNTGYFFLLLLGVLWTLVAIFLSEAKKRNCSVMIFYGFGSLLAAVLMIAIGGVSILRELLPAEKRFAVICFAACAVLNGSGQAVTMANLAKGGRALAYAIPQLAFLCPFIWSVFFWNQRLNWQSGGGVFLIVAATLFLALCRKPDGNADLSMKRVLISTGAMLLCGVSQIVMISPTQLPPERALSPIAGAFVIQLVNSLFFLTLSIIRCKWDAETWKRSARFGAVWGICAAGSFWVLLTTLRILGKINQAGIVFAVGAGITILFFTLFTVVCYREKQTFRQWAAFAAIVAGILLVRL